MKRERSGATGQEALCFVYGSVATQIITAD